MKKPRKVFLPLIITIISMLLFAGSIIGNLVSTEIEDEIRAAFGSNYRVIVILLFVVLTLISGYLTLIQWRQESKSNSESVSFVHQLPELAKGFTGRQENLQELETQFKNSRTKVFGIHGMGGLGKTTLAVAFANRIVNKFDAELFIDMGGTTDQPVKPEEAMLHVVRSYNPAYSDQGNNSLLIGAYRSILKESRVLLLFDNVRDENQIQELIPPTRSILLFTSRQRFSMPDGFSLDLPLMSDEEARRLLIKITNRLDEMECIQIAKLCGHLPIALVKAASSLNKYGNLSVKKYISMLSEIEKRLGLAEASTSLSYNLLTDLLKTAWRKLSVFPQDFGLEAASHILQIHPAECEDIVYKLVQLSLLNVHNTDSVLEGETLLETRFRFHDLDRIFAFSKMKDSEKRNVEIRVAEYYSIVISNISSLYDEGGRDLFLALIVFDKEWPNIEYGQFITTKYSKINQQIAYACINYSLNSMKFLDLRYPKEIMINWSEIAVKVANRRKDLPNEGTALNNLGAAYSDIGEVDKAIPLLLRAAEISRETNMPWLEISRLSNLGNAYRRKGEPDNALKYHMEAYDRAKELNIEDKHLSVLTNIGNVYRDMEDLDNALYYHHQGLKTALAKAQKISEAAALLALTIDYIILGKLITALKYNRLTLNLSRELGLQRTESLSHKLYWAIFKTLTLSFAARKKYFRDVLTIQSDW